MPYRDTLISRYVHPSEIADFSMRFRKEQRSATQHAAILQRALAAPAKVGWRRGQSSGRLDRRAIASLATGLPAKPFRRRVHEEAIDTAISLLVDGSGSMDLPVRGKDGKAISRSVSKLAAMSACVVADAIERGGSAQVEVCTFHDDEEGWLAAHDQVPSIFHRGQARGRSSPSLLVRYKPYGARTASLLGNFRAMEESCLTGTPLAESIENAARRLYARPEGRKILVCWTDGEPNDVYVDSEWVEGEVYTRSVCQQCEDAGIEVVLVGFAGGREAVGKCHWRTAACDPTQIAPATIKAIVAALQQPYQKGGGH